MSTWLHHLKLKILTAGLINQYPVNHFLFHVKKVKIVFIFSHGMCSNVMRLIMMRPRRISVLSVILSVIIRLMSLAEVIFSTDFTDIAKHCLFALLRPKTDRLLDEIITLSFTKWFLALTYTFRKILLVLRFLVTDVNGNF